MEEAAGAITHVEGWLEADDGLRLFWQGWLPPSPRAALVFVHGLAEHSGRYGKPVGHFAPRGYACYALDYRGHGKSPGPRVHVEHFDLYVGDVRTLRRLVGGRHQGLPTFLVGHSQGGLIVLAYVLRHATGLRGVVVSSPFLRTHRDSAPSWAKRAGAALLMRVRPSLPVPNSLDAGFLSHDPAVAEEYARDPLVSHKVSAGWFRAVQQAQREVRAGASQLNLPALVMAGSGDRLVDPEETRAWAEAAPRDRVEFVLWDGLYHELFNETARDQVFGRMESWLERQLAQEAATARYRYISRRWPTALTRTLAPSTE